MSVNETIREFLATQTDLDEPLQITRREYAADMADVGTKAEALYNRLRGRLRAKIATWRTLALFGWLAFAVTLGGVVGGWW